MTAKLTRFAVFLAAITVLARSPAYAQLAPLQQLTAPSIADKLASQSAQAQVAGDHDTALQLANEAIKAD